MPALRQGEGLLIADAGPLFSLAAGKLLDLLLHFRLGITDVVKMETIDRGRSSKASVEAASLLRFYNANAPEIQVFPTQVGSILRARRPARRDLKLPENVGEMSAQSLLIELQMKGVRPPPVVLFEDAWFLRNASSLAKPCALISTQAFLVNAEKLGLIESSTQARAAIAACRPYAYAGVTSVDIDPPRRRG